MSGTDSSGGTKRTRRSVLGGLAATIAALAGCQSGAGDATTTAPPTETASPSPTATPTPSPSPTPSPTATPTPTPEPGVTGEVVKNTVENLQMSIWSAEIEEWYGEPTFLIRGQVKNTGEEANIGRTQVVGRFFEDDEELGSDTHYINSLDVKETKKIYLEYGGDIERVNRYEIYVRSTNPE